MKQGFLVIALFICDWAHAGECVVSPHCAFADQYISQLAAIEGVIDKTKADQKAVQGNTDQMSSMIYSTRAMIIVLQSNINVLKSAQDNADNRKLLSGLYTQQIGYYERLNEIATAFMSGPKPGVDYGALSAEVPQIRAELESSGKLYMTMSNLVFAQLINEKPDANNHMSRLVITKAEHDELLSHLNRVFGKKLDSKNQSSLVDGAWILRSNLQKNYSTADATK